MGKNRFYIGLKGAIALPKSPPLMEAVIRPRRRRWNKTSVILIPSQALLALVEQYPSLAFNLLAGLSRNLRRFANLIDTLSLKDVSSRLAGYLLELSDRQNANPVELDLAKGQLAAFLGTIPETLSRTFAKLTQAQLIEVEARQVKIRDCEGLRRLAAGDSGVSGISG